MILCHLLINCIGGNKLLDGMIRFWRAEKCKPKFIPLNSKTENLTLWYYCVVWNMSWVRLSFVAQIAAPAVASNAVFGSNSDLRHNLRVSLLLPSLDFTSLLSRAGRSAWLKESISQSVQFHPFVFCSVIFSSQKLHD